MHTCNCQNKATTRKVSIIDETRKVKTKLEGKNKIQDPKLGKLKKDLKDNKILKNFFVFHKSDPNPDIFVYKIVQDETVYETIPSYECVQEKRQSKPITLPSISSPSNNPSAPPNTSFETSNCSEFLNIAMYLSSLPLNSIDQIDAQTLKSLFGLKATPNVYNQESISPTYQVYDQDDESTFL